MVYPLVIYNGDTPYRESLTLSDLIESEEAKVIFSTLFTRPFTLVDLTLIEDEVLRKQMQNRLKGITLMMALKHVYDINIQAFLDQTLIKALKKLKVRDKDAAGDILYYLMKEAHYLEASHFKATIHEKLKEMEDDIMTVAQQYEEQGRQKGMQKGIEQSLEMVVFNLLKEEVSLTVIEKATGLSLERILLLQQKWQDTL